jgi:serine/threonine-protein kinase
VERLAPSTLLREHGLLGLPEAVKLASELAEGLEVAHAQGVVHRDLKPHNLFLATTAAGDSLWKILDFGISKLGDGSGTLTQHRVVGTPGYMSPEQTRAGNVDQRSDLFSMAVVLYRALTGRQAFPGTSTPQILFDIVYRSPQRPSLVNHLLPTDVDLVLAIALAKDPDIRFQSATELARAVRSAVRNKLGSELRARGHGVIKAYPWGEPISLRGG